LRRRALSFLGTLLATATTLATAAPRAHAYEAEVDAQTVGQAYQLRGLTGDPVLSRRRVTQTLALGVHNLTDTARSDGPEISFQARMRLDADFGIAREEYSLAPIDTNRFVPLLLPAPVEMMYGYLEGRRLAGGVLSFRLGRQYVIDPLGYYAFDGGLVRVTTPVYVSLVGYGGYEVRGGLPLSSNPQIGRWEMGGVGRTDRSDYPPNGYPSVQPQSLAPVYGVALETAGPSWIHGRVTYRKAYNTGSSFVGGSGALLGPDQMAIYDGTRTAQERLGYGLNVTIGEIAGVRGNVVYDLYGARWNQVDAGIDLFVGKRITTSVDYQYWRPIFDSDSIFNVFGYEPMDDFVGRVEVQATDRLNVAVDGNVRRFRADDETDAARERGARIYASADHYAPGAGLRAIYRWPTARLVFRGSGITGDQGRRVGGDISYDRTIAQRYLLDARISLWDWSDRLRTDRGGGPRNATSFGYVVGGGYRFTPEANGMLQFEHDMNQLVGMRYRILAVLNVRVWL
jgi:hypothetical protein